MLLAREGDVGLRCGHHEYGDDIAQHPATHTQGVTAEIVQVGTPDSPAVLAISGGTGTELPTAPLAAQAPSVEGSAVNVAGFLGRPSAGKGDHVDVAHLGKGGTGATGRGFADPQKKVDEPVKLGGWVDRGLLGGPVIGDKDGHVIGLLTGGGKDARMIGVREITSALQRAGVTARRGPIDTAFEASLTRFHNRYYGQAVPGFQRVLELSPGHVMAAKHLKTALARRGGPEDQGAATTEPPRGTPSWPFAVVVATRLLRSPKRHLIYAERCPSFIDPPGAAGLPTSLACPAAPRRFSRRPLRNRPLPRHP
ncbi:hypothetical protein [Nonomuraea sp. CA-141351]|uniref:hypothetical protein n=1 Tax=Nonomuraea sp. CA-141351 TaxID=3239996 RepID=UPI003D8A4AA0